MAIDSANCRQAMTVVLADFNLLVSTSRGYENDACSELWFLLGEIGDQQSLVERSDVSGLIVANTALDPLTVIKDLRKMARERPWEFRYTLKVVPVEAVVRTKLEDIRRASLDLSSKISEEEAFRVTVEKRHTKLSTKEIVEAVAAGIDRKVNLENPDKIVLIQILGGLTGVSVIKPDDILSVAKERTGQP